MADIFAALAPRWRDASGGNAPLEDSPLGDALLGDALLGDALLGDALLGDAPFRDASGATPPLPKVVLKKLIPSLRRDARFERMLENELRIASAVRHPNVVQMYGLERHDEQPFIVMEYVEGLDLNRLLRGLSHRSIGLPPQLALSVVNQVLAALGAVSVPPLSVVHRDVSPANVLLSFSGEVKLCDFGIATSSLVEPRPNLNSYDEASHPRWRVIGKAAYMSPEHARGQTLDARSDLFSVGVVLWELAAGRRLRRGDGPSMLALARGDVVPPLPDRGLPDSDRLRAIVARATAPEPSQRYASAAEMRAALKDYVSRTGMGAGPAELGAFLREHFDFELLQPRRDRERAAYTRLRRRPAERDGDSRTRKLDARFELVDDEEEMTTPLLSCPVDMLEGADNVDTRPLLDRSALSPSADGGVASAAHRAWVAETSTRKVRVIDGEPFRGPAAPMRELVNELVNHAPSGLSSRPALTAGAVVSARPAWVEGAVPTEGREGESAGASGIARVAAAGMGLIAFGLLTLTLFGWVVFSLGNHAADGGREERLSDGVRAVARQSSAFGEPEDGRGDRIVGPKRREPLAR